MAYQSKRIEALRDGKTLVSKRRNQYAVVWYSNWTERYYMQIGYTDQPPHLKRELRTEDEIVREIYIFADLRHWNVKDT